MRHNFRSCASYTYILKRASGSQYCCTERSLPFAALQYWLLTIGCLLLSAQAYEVLSDENKRRQYNTMMYGVHAGLINKDGEWLARNRPAAPASTVTVAAEKATAEKWFVGQQEQDKHQSFFARGGTTGAASSRENIEARIRLNQTPEQKIAARRAARAAGASRGGGSGMLLIWVGVPAMFYGLWSFFGAVTKPAQKPLGKRKY